MAYSLSTFLKPLSQTDTSVQIMNSDMVVKWTINPFTVKNVFLQNNLVKISLNSDREVVLDFRTTNESKQAIVKLQSALEVLRNKTPQYIDKIIEEYIHGIGLSYSNGNLYFSANLIPSINSTFSIGLSGSNWLDLHVGSSSIYLGDVKLSSENSNLIINDSFEISSPTQSTTWLGKKLIETFTDGIITTIDETRSHLYSEVGEVGLESYYNPDGVNNIVKGKVRTFPGGVILESSVETVGGTVSGIVVVGANGFQFNQTDGVVENNFEFSDTLYINGVDYLSKGGILTQTFLINSNNYDYIINGVDSLILSSSVFDVVSDFISIDSSGSGQILADEDLTFMAGGEMSIIGSSSLITTNNGLGLVYTDDYSANFVDNSLVSKKFVLDNINSGGAGGAGKIWQYGGGPLGDGLFNYYISGTFVSVTVDYDDANGTARDWTLTTSKLIDSGETLFVSMVDLTNPAKYLTYEAYEYFDGGGFSINGILYQNGTSFTTGSNISFAYSTVAKNAGQQGPVGPTGSQGDSGPQGPTGPSGAGGGARFINTLLPNSPGSLGPVNFQLSMPWPYDSQRGISFQNEYIYINSSDIVRWYNVQLSFHIYNAANETYGYSLKYNTGSGTFSLMDTNINGASDNNKRQTTSEIIRVPAGVTASLYFTRYTTVTDEEAVVGSLNVIEII